MLPADLSGRLLAPGKRLTENVGTSIGFLRPVLPITKQEVRLLCVAPAEKLCLPVHCSKLEQHGDISSPNSKRLLAKDEVAL